MKQTISPVFLLGKCSEAGQMGHFYPAPWWLLHTPWPHAVHSCSLCLCPLSSSWQSGHWCSERRLWNLNIILNNLWNLNIILNNLYINIFVSFLNELSLLPESTVGINGVHDRHHTNNKGHNKVTWIIYSNHHLACKQIHGAKTPRN